MGGNCVQDRREVPYFHAEVSDLLLTSHELQCCLPQYRLLHVESLMEHTHLLIALNEVESCIIALLQGMLVVLPQLYMWRNSHLVQNLSTNTPSPG